MGFERALDFVTAALEARDAADPAVAENQRTQVYRGKRGAGVVMLLHGLTASPPAWRAVAEALHARGRTVIVPRLLLHGHADRMTDALQALTPEALVEDVTAMVTLAETLGESLTIAGHSLGATLAIDAVARTQSVARIVAVAPFLGISRVPYEAHAVMLRMLDRLPNVFLWWDPRAKDTLMPAHGYPRYPINAISAGMSIADRARAAVPHAGAVDIVLNDRESSVSNRTARRLAENWRTAGVSVAVHRIVGLGWSHDIIEPERPPAQLALATLLEIIDADHAPADRVHHITPEN